MNIQDIIIEYIGQWGWLLIAAIATYSFKETIINFFVGIQFLLGNDFNIDDIVYIRGAKRARIVRQNIWKTTFYVYGHKRKFVVPNNMLWKLEIEKDIDRKNEFGKEDLINYINNVTKKKDIS